MLRRCKFIETFSCAVRKTWVDFCRREVALSVTRLPLLGSPGNWKLRARYCNLPPRSFSFPAERLRTYPTVQSWEMAWSSASWKLQGSVRLGCQRTGNQSQSKGWASLVSRGAIRRETLLRQSYSRYKVGFNPRREKARGWLHTETFFRSRLIPWQDNRVRFGGSPPKTFNKIMNKLSTDIHKESASLVILSGRIFLSEANWFSCLRLAQ